MKRLLAGVNAKSSIARGAIILGFFYLMSAVLGFLRDRLLASTFGAENRLLDSYYAAFRIPDFIFNVLILGAVSAAFVPVFISYFAKGKTEDEAWKFANVVFNVGGIAMVVIGIVVIVFANPLLTVFTAGFKGTNATFLDGSTVPLLELTVRLTRIMMASAIFFGISAIAGSIQNSLKRFTVYAAAPVIYNLGIIFGIIILAPKFDIFGVAYGVVIGAFAQMAAQMASAYHLGFRHMLIFNLKHTGLKRVSRLMVFRAGALMVDQINLLVAVSVGSTLPAGSIAYYTLANNLERLPVTLFAVSLATAAFPTLAEKATLTQAGNFIKEYSASLRRILFFVIPISVMFILFRREITTIILSSGQFNPENARITASTLGFFAVSLFAQATMPITVRAFFSLQDTRTPFFISLLTMILHFGAAIFVSRTLGFGAPGLAVAFSLTSISNVVLLIIFLRKKLGSLDLSTIFISVAKIMLSCAAMGAAIVALLRLFGTDLELSKTVILGHLVIIGTLSGSIYVAGLWLLRSKEIDFLRDLVGRLSKILPK